MYTIIQFDHDLKNKIDLLREELIAVGLKDGLGSEKTILLSQQLDFYIAKYQSLYYKK